MISQRDIVVDHADPLAPMGSKPSFPNIRIQLTKTLNRFAISVAHTIGARRPIAWSTWRKTPNAKNATTLGMMRSVYSCAIGTISAGWRSAPSTGAVKSSRIELGMLTASARISPRHTARAIDSSSRAPTAWLTTGSSAISIPTPKMETPKK